MSWDSSLALARGESKTLLAETAVAEENTAETSPLMIHDGDNFSLFLKGFGANVHLKIIRCYNPSIHLETNGAPDPSMWAEADLDGIEDILVADFRATVWRITQEKPKCSVWLKYKITGLANNGADTKISMSWVKQVKVPAS